MGKYILQRLLLMLVAVFLIVSATFVLMKSLPGEMGVDDPNIDPVLRDVLIANYGLDKPVMEQYVIFMKNVFTGNLGTSTSLAPKREVYKYIMDRMPITIQLNLMSSVLVYPIGLGLGIIMALKKNKMTDNVLNVLIVFFISVPSFVVAALLQYFLSFKLDLFPLLLSTNNPNKWSMSWEKFRSMVLPVLAMSFGGIMGIARQMRGELAETLTSEHMLLAKTKGLNRRQATMRHALRNSFLPMTGMLVFAFTGLLFGSLYIENQFSIPGVGGMLTKAINVMDVPMVIGWVLMVTLINLTAIIVVDLLYGVIDPRVRIGGKKSAV